MENLNLLNIDEKDLLAINGGRPSGMGDMSGAHCAALWLGSVVVGYTTGFYNGYRNAGR
ncbi:hypothetical protein [Clostridium botulinum]|uniref:Uncharacterized protein n=1 Tax=Clostridium botulinum (strain Langeland / NCTC 10281 / Type F) TaxID=441772 RepID=A7GJQ0_CLOBL|nr:hypothetical protein [Clostridium botulinum]ABS42929.1 hypothetical protein CLI_A0006 [Clostridium botulinum F str. Langeland]ADG01362.1 hypothetical protein CBF_P0006 [Clostridium botulinum F str. 230613]MBY6794616.1 hypothetical protein [Clostridium botulinum]MBY6939366.1 hypothetical protein [Clostridium botulinum]MBY6946513.1 hypothetical protein [Clostridium botulinum]